MRLGTVLRKWRAMEELGIREVAKQMGVSTATLSRFEQGYNCDGVTLSRILLWLFGKDPRP